MIAIIGAGGHGKCVYECLKISGADIYGFFDDDAEKQGKEIIDGCMVQGPVSAVTEAREVQGIFVAVGDNRSRMQIYDSLYRQGYRFPNAVHPRVYCSEYSRIGAGVFIMGAAVINPHAEVADYAIINTSATVGHDCRVGRAAQIAPGVKLGGGAVLEEGVFIGIGAMVAPGIRVGAWSIVGAGAVVLTDVPAGVFSCGIPARSKNK